MKRLIILLLLIALAFCSCADRTVIKSNSEKAVNTEHSVDNCEYVLVKVTQRFHAKNCSLLPLYKDSEKTKIADLEFIERCGYISCKYCLPYIW